MIIAIIVVSKGSHPNKSKHQDSTTPQNQKLQDSVTHALSRVGGEDGHGQRNARKTKQEAGDVNPNDSNVCLRLTNGIDRSLIHFSDN